MIHYALIAEMVKAEERDEAIIPFNYLMLCEPYRQSIITDVKAPMQRAIEGIGKSLWTFPVNARLFTNALKKMPEPTRKNCTEWNVQILFDIRDKYLNNIWLLPLRRPVAMGFKVAIAECEHDGYYLFRLSWCIKRLNDLGWAWADRRERLHVIEKVRDEFAVHEDNPGRLKMFMATFKVAIVAYRHSFIARKIVDGLISDINGSDWRMSPDTEFCWSK